jgi:5-methylcytosine-specific restriction enzyme A
MAARLKSIGSRLSSAPVRLGHAAPLVGADRDRARQAVAPWRAWYKTKAWQRLRWQVLVRDLFTCGMCGWVGAAETRRLVADHKVAHRGDEGRFWDPAGIWCLCKDCHDGAKQSAERRGIGGV